MPIKMTVFRVFFPPSLLLYCLLVAGFFSIALPRLDIFIRSVFLRKEHYCVNILTTCSFTSVSGWCSKDASLWVNGAESLQSVKKIEFSLYSSIMVSSSLFMFFFKFAAKARARTRISLFIQLSKSNINDGT